jgi:single-strand DNA-binding protein
LSLDDAWRLVEGYVDHYNNVRLNSATGYITPKDSVVFYGELSEIAVGFEKGDNIFIEGTLQTRKFTPRDGSQRTVHEVVARSVHQIVRSRIGKETPSDNAPDAEDPVVPEPVEPTEEPEDGEIWPS